MDFKKIEFRRSFWLMVIPGLFLAVLAWSSLTFSWSRAAVTLLYFTATGGNNQVTLNWATATEIDNIGFFVQRSLQHDGTYTRVNTTIIPADGDSFTGATYNYIDNGVTNGNQYWYRLESIDSGQQSTYSDPVDVTIGSVATPTMTATQPGSPGATPTLTQTPSPTNSNTTPVPTSTRTPTSVTFSQAIPTSTSPAIPTLTQSNPNPESVQNPPGLLNSTPDNLAGELSTTPQANLPGEPTTTFAPFPTVTIEFPAKPDISAPLPKWEDGNGAPDLKSITGLWPLGLVILIWVALGAWFYFTHRHFH